MRILVCGGRDYKHRDRLYRVLDNLAEAHPAFVLIHGGCRTGADYLADEWAAVSLHPRLIFNANWKAHGRAAGPIRNQRMIDEGAPNMVVAAPGGKGTADMVRRARAANITVFEVGPPTA